MDGLTAAYDLFGKSGDQIYGAVKNGTLDFANLGASAEDASGSVSKTFEEARDPVDDFKTTMNNLKVTLAEIAVPIMEILKPVLEKLGDVIKTLSEKWKGLSEDQQMTIVKIAGVAAAIGPLLAVIGRLTTGIGGIAKGIGAVIANPIPALIAAAVAAIAFAVYEIVTHWEEIKAWFTAFKDALVEMFGMIGEWFSEKFTAAKEAVLNAWNGVGKFEGQGGFTNLRAIALLINKDTKEIVNAAIMPVLNSGETVGISTLTANDQMQSTVYNLNGQQVTTLNKGIYIKNGKKFMK